MDRLLNLFSTVSNSVSISGWPPLVVKHSLIEAPSWTGCSICSLSLQLCLHFRMALPRGENLSDRGPIMDRLLNLFSTVLPYSVSISGWASPGGEPSLIEAPIMDRLLNLFSAVSNSVSISGWPSPGGETLSDRGTHHGQAAQPVLCSLQTLSSISGLPSPEVKTSLIEAPIMDRLLTPALYSLHFRMALPRW
ncbi:hypothetical protein DPMN_147133 [Dreissena polymorpha]|uniref:Uncharacterized protein n=1 Tax=Dreissena polymorpha TaxID=45954 RepID=A0A9D4F998_DREPO|nr:hypothetical protein DPMN_147133 [Dreissena polymorpha]